MAFKIVTSQCTACGACEYECPNGAVKFKGDVYIIDPNACTECKGQFDAPQCVSVCPVPKTCIPA